MNTKDNGGSAFPVTEYKIPGEMKKQTETGMTLRDYFAAKAMQAMIGKLPAESETSFFDDAIEEDVANCSYIYADAMLAAREKPNVFSTGELVLNECRALAPKYVRVSAKSIIPPYLAKLLLSAPLTKANKLYEVCMNAIGTDDSPFDVREGALTFKGSERIISRNSFGEWFTAAHKLNK